MKLIREELGKAKPLALIHLGDSVAVVMDSIMKHAILIETACSFGTEGKAAQLALENVFTSEANDQLDQTYQQLIASLKPHLSD